MLVDPFERTVLSPLIHQVHGVSHLSVNSLGRNEMHVPPRLSPGMVTGSHHSFGGIFYEYGAHSDSFFDWVPAKPFGQRVSCSSLKLTPSMGSVKRKPGKLTFLGHQENVPAQKLSQLGGRVATEMNVLAGPKFLVDAILVVLDELPLIANGDLGMFLHYLEGPRVEKFLHYPCRPARRPAFFDQVGGGRKSVGHGTGGHPDQLGLGLLEFGDDLFEVLLIAGFVVFAVPMTMIETDDVPVAAGLTIRPQPLQDAGPSLCRRSAIGGRVMQVELTR